MKDNVLGKIGRIGTAGATAIIEFALAAPVRDLSIKGDDHLHMSIEAVPAWSPSTEDRRLRSGCTFAECRAKGLVPPPAL